MLAGMDVARLNFSHGDHVTHAESVARIRAAAREAGKPVAILGDLQGPKLRVGTMAEGGVLLRAQDRVTLTTRQIVGTNPRAIPVQYGGLPRLVSPGNRVLLDDGLLELAVESATETEIHCHVVTGGILRSNKGMNLPLASLDIPSITAKDQRDLAFALQQGVDWLALSFVRTADEVLELKRLIAETAPEASHTPVMAKIEKPEALRNITQIIRAVDGIMVARGDLGIEIRPEEVPLAQKRIIAACNGAGVPVVTATQMLESMVRNPRPTRAEASDVANAILDGTDAVMLSAETSVGDYPLETVRTMARIASEVEAHRPTFSRSSAHEAPCTGGVAGAVVRAAAQMARDLDAAAIVTPTVSGYTARLMSRQRAPCPIVAVTPRAAVQRQLMLHWGVTPLLAPRTNNSDEMISDAVRAARDGGLIGPGDTVVITAGAAGSAPGTTNLIMTQVVNE